MKSWNVALLFFLFIFLFVTCIAVLFFISSQKQIASPTFLPSENGNISVFFCPKDACEQQLLFFLNQTTSSIDCAFYSLNIPSVILLLQQKSVAGVPVRVVIDADNSGGVNSDALAAVSSLSFVHVDTRAAYMHDKFCILDNKIVMTGSMNPTVSDTTKNNNNLVFVSSSILAQNYEEEFASLWQGTFGKDATVRTPRFLLNNFTVENYFCPEDKCEEHILAVLATANQSIHFMTFSFTSDTIGDVLLEKSKTVEIAGVMEKSQNNAYSEYEKLHALNVSWDGNSAFMHHKVFIVDSKIVITGSMNPSKNGNEKNDENILIIYDPEIAALYEDEFQATHFDAKM